MPDAIFEVPRLAEIYDALEAERPDLSHYLALVHSFGAERVLDIGCGTGSFACLLARDGIDVTAVDPASASLDVARTKAFSERVLWVLGDATAAPAAHVDLVTMTGNVGQVFLSDEAWSSTLRATHAALRPGGRLVFEVRDPEMRGWLAWTRDRSYRCLDLPEIGVVETWTELTEVALPLVRFRQHFVFHSDGASLVSESTLRFRSRSEVTRSLLRTNFVVDEVRDAPDRPGKELVFVASSTRPIDSGQTRAR